MSRAKRMVAVVVVLMLLIVGAVLMAPTQQRYWDECNAKGGMYVPKSMQCISKDGIENMLWK